MKIDASVVSYLTKYFISKDRESTISKGFLPNADATVSLGTHTNRFKALYVETLVADFGINYGLGSDVDMLDGFHAVSEPLSNSILALNASAIFPTSVYPLALLTDGSRGLTGDLAVTSGVKIDGVDISAHAASPIHHLSGMAVDDHTQYVHVNNARTITAVHTFSPAATTAPFVLSANAQGHTVIGLQADKLDKSINTGSGLTGGGPLIASLTLGLDWGTPTITTIQPDDMASAGVSTNPAKSDHKHAVATAAPGSNSVNLANSTEGSSTSFARADHNHQLDQGIAPTWSSTHKFDNATAGISSSGVLKISAGSTILIDPTGGQVEIADDTRLQSDGYSSQAAGWGISGDGRGDFRYLYVDEMHSKAFVTDFERALAGGEIVTKSVTVVAADFTIPAASAYATLWVEDLPGAPGVAAFESGDVVRLRQFVRASGALVIADVWGVVTLYADGTGANEGLQSWRFTRSAAPNAGTATAGTAISAKSLALDYGKPATGGGYHEINTVDGGAWGPNSPYSQTATWATHPATGFTVRTRVGNLEGIKSGAGYGLYAGNGVADASEYIIVGSGTGTELHNLSLKLYDGAVVKVQVLPAKGILVSNAAWGTDSSTFAAVFADDATVTFLDAGDILIGRPFHSTNASKVGLHWDDSAGTLNLVRATLDLYNSSHQKTVSIQPDGDAFFGSNLAAQATTSLAIFSVAQKYPLTTGEDMGAGDILIGSNATGYGNLLWDASDKKLKFRGGTTMQAEIGTDGKIYAGGGKVVLDSAGLWLSSSSAAPDSGSSIKFSTDFSAEVSSLSSYYGAGDNYMKLWVKPVASKHSLLNITAQVPATYYPWIELFALHTGDTSFANAGLRMVSTDAYFYVGNKDDGATDLRVYGGLSFAKDATADPANAAPNTVLFMDGGWIGLGTGASGAACVDFTTNTNIYKTGFVQTISTGWIGIGPSAGRIVFSDATPDTMVVTAANFGVGTASAPAYLLDVSGYIRASSNVLVKGTTTVGSVMMTTGSATNTGYISWYLSSADGALGTRLGYMGYDASDIKLALENGARFVINSTATPAQSHLLLQANSAGGLSALCYAAGNVHLGFDVHYDGAAWTSLYSGSNYEIYKLSNLLQFRYGSGVAAGSAVTMTAGFSLNTAGNLMIGTTTDGMTAAGSLAIAKDLAHRGSYLGVFNVTPTTKQTVTGSRGSNAALASLLTALAAYGLITNSSTA
jgi:hypothetical protein